MTSTTPTGRLLQDLNATVRELDRLSSCLDRIAEDFREYNLMLACLERDADDYHPRHLTVELRQFHRFLLNRLGTKIDQMDEELLRCKNELRRMSEAISGVN